MPRKLPSIEARHLGRLFMAPVPADQGERSAADAAGVPHFIVFRRDFRTAPGLAALTARLAGRARRARLGAPLLALDEEGGLVSQLRSLGLESPGPRALALGEDGAARAHPLAARSGRATGRALRSLGFNLNFAPVADVDTATDSPVIGARAVSCDPAETASWCAAWIRAHQASGVAATAKHFPGHGAAELDSHLTLPAVDRPRALLKRVDLPPFMEAVRAGVGAVMTAHVRYASIEPRLPATLSPRVLALLRGTLDFDGLVVTDSLDMAGVRRFGDAAAAVRSLLAGCDLLLYAMPGTLWLTGYRAVTAAVRAGRVPRERLEQAMARVDRLARDYPLGSAGALGTRAAARVIPPPAALRRQWDLAVRKATEFRGLPPGSPSTVEIAGNPAYIAPLADALRAHGVDAREAAPGGAGAKRGARRAHVTRDRGARSGLTFGLMVIGGRRDWQPAEARQVEAWRREGRPFGVVSLLSERRLHEPPARGAMLVACPYEDTPRALEAVAALVADTPPGRRPRAKR